MNESKAEGDDCPDECPEDCRGAKNKVAFKPPPLPRPPAIDFEIYVFLVK